MVSKRRLTPEERTARVAAIDHMYRHGCSSNDIASYLNVSQGTVVSSLDTANTPRRRRGRPRAGESDRPSPVDIMGLSWEPDFLTPEELIDFKNRVEFFTGYAREAQYDADTPTQPRLPFEGEYSLFLMRPLASEVELGMGELAVASDDAVESSSEPPLAELIASRLSLVEDPAAGELIEDTGNSSPNSDQADDELIAY